MAGVKPVEYIKDSSTAGFAVAGDQKPITDNNANTIKKDVDELVDVDNLIMVKQDFLIAKSMKIRLTIQMMK